MTQEVLGLAPAGNDGCGLYRVMRVGEALVRRANIAGVKIPLNMPKVEWWGQFNKVRVLTQRPTMTGISVYWKLFRAAYPDADLSIDLDDLLWGAHPRSTYRYGLDQGRNMDNAMSAATRITASTIPLQAQLEKRYKRPVSVVPNTVLAKDFKPLSVRKTGQKLRILYAGSATHSPDLDQIIPAVRETSAKYDWVFMGCIPDALKGHVRFQHHVPVGKYLDTIHAIGAHVGIAPLISSEFNECKSNVKLLEYGLSGLATIASDAYPYRGSEASIVRKPRAQDWIKAITEMEDEATRLDAATRSQDYARQFEISNHIDTFMTAHGFTN